MSGKNERRFGKDNVEPTTGIRGAEYVRMSTEHQKYSTENQADAIRGYAAQRGIEIVRTYGDQGKSGLSLDGRDALKRLIDDVQNGRADFETILVYDVSRWGRFQDADEGAYYEQVCKRAGITVQYCAEQFENDGGLASVVVKNLKRAMAGEYSRELSVKVFAGQCRLIELGYRQGGPPGYGLRRQLIDQTGAAKSTLTRGDQKSLQTDRVILVPGPAEEIETVRCMYEAFVEEQKSELEIASMLNARGIPTDLGRLWTRATVHQVLINEKYVGNNVWNRRSFKLKKKRVLNSPDAWIRAEGVFDAIVDLPLFNAAQTLIRERSVRVTDDDMLESLRQLFQKRGYLSGMVIDEADHLPSSTPISAGLAVYFAPINWWGSRRTEIFAISKSIARCVPCIQAWWPIQWPGSRRLAGKLPKTRPRTFSLSTRSSARLSLSFAARTLQPDQCGGTFALTLDCCPISPSSCAWIGRTVSHSITTCCLAST